MPVGTFAVGSLSSGDGQGSLEPSSDVSSGSHDGRLAARLHRRREAEELQGEAGAGGTETTGLWPDQGPFISLQAGNPRCLGLANRAGASPGAVPTGFA